MWETLPIIVCPRTACGGSAFWSPRSGRERWQCLACVPSQRPEDRILCVQIVDRRVHVGEALEFEDAA